MTPWPGRGNWKRPYPLNFSRCPLALSSIPGVSNLFPIMSIFMSFVQQSYQGLSRILSTELRHPLNSGTAHLMAVSRHLRLKCEGYPPSVFNIRYGKT
jgi:hypothetical protein